MTGFKSDIAETPEERRLKADVGRLNDALADEHDRLVKALAEIERLKTLFAKTEDRLGRVPCRDNRCVEMAEAKAEIERLKDEVRAAEVSIAAQGDVIKRLKDEVAGWVSPE